LPKIPPPASGDYPELPEKEWFEVEIKSIEAFLDTRFPKEDGTPKPSFRFIFEAVAEELTGSRVWGKSSQSWDERSNLYKIAQATFDAQQPNEVIYELEIPEDLEGKTLLLMGEYKSEDRKYLTPTDYKRKAPATTARTAVAKTAAKPAAAKAPEPDGAIEI
jgi:hypothetical protein